jgi:ankyrin repeat protein
VQAVEYLLKTLPDAGLGVQFGMQWVRGDIHGDTPLHAAAAAGNAQCTELLLQALQIFPSVLVDLGAKTVADIRNGMQMTPAHLASSAECLDVLYR